MSFVQSVRRVAKGESSIDITGKWKTWFAASAILLLIAVGGLFIRHLNLGLAFEGGSAFSAPVTSGQAPSIASIEDRLIEVGLESPQVQIARASDGRQVIRIEAETVGVRAAVVEKLAEISGTPADEIDVQEVGPTWGSQISSKALRALIVFLILVVFYISLRFELKMAICTIVSLVHDVVITVGIYAIIGFEVSPATVVAYLSILGYSLYDSVVVFDKVRENQVLLTGTSRMTYSAMVNKSVNQTIMRSINTSLSVLLPVGALLFVGVYLFGAQTLKDLALSLFIGTAVGSYSSVFIGPPLLAILKEREPRYRQLASRARAMTPATATAGAGAAAGGVTTSGGTDTTATRTDAGRSAPTRTGASGVQPRGRKKSRKKRR